MSSFLHRQFGALDSRRLDLNKDGRGCFKAYSAGSHPKGAVNPFALKVLRSFNYPAEGFSSKAWECSRGCPVMDFVFTVCAMPPGRRAPSGPASR